MWASIIIADPQQNETVVVMKIIEVFCHVCRTSTLQKHGMYEVIRDYYAAESKKPNEGMYPETYYPYTIYTIYI